MAKGIALFPGHMYIPAGQATHSLDQWRATKFSLCRLKYSVEARLLIKRKGWPASFMDRMRCFYSTSATVVASMASLSAHPSRDGSATDPFVISHALMHMYNLV